MKYDRELLISKMIDTLEPLSCPKDIGLDQKRNDQCFTSELVCRNCFKDSLEQVLVPSEEEAK